MHFGIFTYGSRGDVQPFVSLALGLMQQGHRVTVAAPENFKHFVEGYGVRFFPLHGDFNQMLYDPEGLHILRTKSSFAFVRYLLKAVHRVREEMEKDFFEGCKDLDALIVSNAHLLRAGIVAEKLNLRWAVLHINLPVLQPTRGFSALGFKTPWLNLLTTRILTGLFWRMARKDTNAFRSRLGLTPAKKSAFKAMAEDKVLNLFAFSPELFARPADWREEIKVTGFLTLPQTKREAHPMDRIPEGLPAWLAMGEKPVYVGFGSIPVPDPERFGSILNDILTTTPTRIVFCTGHSSIPGLPEHPNLFVLRHTNHEWLLPQCKAAVTHGGIGTVAAVVKAGIPVIVVSIIGDQAMWGKLLARKQVGIHIPWKKLSAGKLLRAFEEADNRQVVASALETGRKINREDGVTTAVQAVESYFSQ